MQIERAYVLNRHRHQWGDYFNMLMHGMGRYRPRVDGQIRLYRTGPYIPPLSLPQAPVVTEGFRKMLEDSGLVGCQFQPVIKELIVHSDWHTWDRTAAKPLRYPPEGEPENYILEQPHSDLTAQQMGNLWELVLQVGAKISNVERSDRKSLRFVLHADSWQGVDFFRVEDKGFVFVTDRAKEWLEQHVGEYITFREVDVSQ